MKGQIFWQQIAKMCLKKKNQERRKNKEKAEKFICMQGNVHCTEAFESIYTYSFRPVITFLKEHIHEQEFAELF